MAEYVITLAEKTGWLEEYIVWRLPLARLLQYRHAICWRDGAWTIPLVIVEENSAPAEEQFDTLFDSWRGDRAEADEPPDDQVRLHEV